jgi:hypothetical protein
MPDEAKTGGCGCEEDLKAELGTVDFSTFVLSLGTQVLYHLGVTESPESGKGAVDLAMARHFIDIIGMLMEKTRGNLTPDETRLIDMLLFDLRLKYVEVCKTAPKAQDAT